MVYFIWGTGYNVGMETMESIPWGKRWDTPVFEESVVISEELTLILQREGEKFKIVKRSPLEDEESLFIIKEGESLFLDPLLPEHPLVIKPSTRLSILPDIRFNAYVEVPLLINLSAGADRGEHTLTEVILHTLSKSFFGSPESGEIAYFLESPLHEKLEEYDSENTAFAPLCITNRSNQILHFERMILRVPHLSLYSREGRIYTSPVDIKFKGQDQISQTKIRTAPPRISGLSPAAPPRTPVDRSIIKRSFYFMKSIYNGF